MEKPTKKKLKQMLSSLTVQEKIAHPPVTIEKNLDTRIKNILTSQGMQLLTKQINNIIERQKLNMKIKSKQIEEQDFKQMKRNLKIYGKNKKQYRVQKIIKFGPQTPQPLKNIVKVHENKFTIVKEHNIKLSQKIDAIIQQQNIIRMKDAKRQHLQGKMQQPLIRQLKRFRSTHNFGRTEKNSSTETTIKSKGQSTWTQRTVYFESCKMGEQKSMQKYKRGNFQKYQKGQTIELGKNRNSLQGILSQQKQNFSKFTNFYNETKCASKGLPTRRLKRKAIEYN